MLNTNTIPTRTLELLNGIMAVAELKDFVLAGGTSLALQIGHRISEDLDFFGKRPFEKDEIIDLISHLGSVNLMSQSKNILVLNINEIKVDFVNYRYPYLKPTITEDEIRLVSIPDIAAMKLSAITGRGRKRDFIDLYFLLKSYSLKELLSFYNQKYADGSEFLVARSLIYFEDADQDEDLQLLISCDWEQVKIYLQKEAKKIFN